MNILTMTVAPPYSLILLCDAAQSSLPETMARQLVAATETCIAIGCRAEDDGETQITIGPAHQINPGSAPVFQGNLDTPSRMLVIQSVMGNTFLEQSVGSDSTYIEIWASNPLDPDMIMIGIADGADRSKSAPSVRTPT